MSFVGSIVGTQGEQVEVAFDIDKSAAGGNSYGFAPATGNLMYLSLIHIYHARDFIRGGIAPESSAYSSGNALSDYIMGGDVYKRQLHMRYCLKKSLY